MFDVRRFVLCVVWFLAVLLCAHEVSIAGIGDWKTYTSKREVRDVTFDKNNRIIWAATNGGLFSYRSSDGMIMEYTTSDGLRSIDITAIVIDGKGAVWSGASNGFIHTYDPVNHQWRYISDIFQLNAPSKRINKLQIIGDTLFILSDVGVSMFSLSRMEFGDTYMRFGTLPNQFDGNATSVEISNGKLWVSTISGIASTPVSNPNPMFPDSWQVYTTAQGLPSNAVHTLGFHDRVLTAATSKGLATFNDTTWITIPGTTVYNVLDFFTSDTSCLGCPSYFIASSQLMKLSGITFSLEQQFTFPLMTMLSDSVLGSQLNGVIVHSDTIWKSVIPNGPPTNSFIGMTVDERGVLWSGTGSISREGFNRFDGRTWRTYNPSTYPILGTADSGGGASVRINLGPNNTKWVSSWGRGVAMVGADDEIQKVFNHSNGLSSTLPPPDTMYVVVHGVASDANGDVWINVRTATDDSVLAVYSPANNSFRYVKYPSTTVPILTNIIMDGFGTMWFTTTSGVGLVLYNPGTGWDIVSTADGLTDNNISAVAYDNDGSIWVGTQTPKGGINILDIPSNPRHILIYHPLRDQNINDILVDPVNNKWIATDNGVFVLSSDGTSILQQFTNESTNGSLPDNKVISIAMNRSNGTIYFGTENGLASLTTTAVTPQRAFSELLLKPNPFYLPATKELVVDGLVENSRIKILSIDGTVVRDLGTPGGRIGFWDGRDKKGDVVSTGVYLVVAYSSDGKQVAAGKVAVVRK